jgi:nucleoside-diphosphate-sugar epimerase
VSDIAEGTVRALKPVGFEIINLGNSHPHELAEMISLVEHYLGKKARVRRESFQKTDMMATWADIGKAKRLLDWEPEVPLSEGIGKTVDWYLKNREWLRNIHIDMSK